MSGLRSPHICLLLSASATALLGLPGLHTEAYSVFRRMEADLTLLVQEILRSPVAGNGLPSEDGPAGASPLHSRAKGVAGGEPDALVARPRGTTALPPHARYPDSPNIPHSLPTLVSVPRTSSGIYRAWGRQLVRVLEAKTWGGRPFLTRWPFPHACCPP